MDMYIVMSMLFGILQMTSARSVKGSKESKRSCRLHDLPLQREFDMAKFEGKWYGTLKTGMGDSVLSYFTEIYDTRIFFERNSEGAFDLRAAGSKFYGGWCPKGKGHAAIPLRGEPEKMTMYFDTTIGRKIGMKPAWILKTDYSNFAIIYSCWKESADGTCDKASAYVGVLQRSPKVLTSNKRAEVDKALKSACVDPRKLSPISHYGYCPGHNGL